tara:strand:- start:310 stop:513 length:204 start_codon:yes stop_codon:yes gene_type:complete
MNKIELTEKELVVVLGLINNAKGEVAEALDNHRDEAGECVPMGHYPAFALSRELDSLQQLLHKLGSA